MNNILFLFRYSKGYSTSDAILQVILQSVVAERSIKIIVCSTLAEEVKIVNDFMMCFTQLGDQKGVRECQFMT